MSAQRDFIEGDGPGSHKADRNQVLSRQWGRTGWHPLHLIMCATGLPFFRREVVPFDLNRDREAAVYVNEFTDLLLDVRRRARVAARAEGGPRAAGR